MTPRSDKGDLYKQAGVDVEKGDVLVDWLQKSPAQTSKTGAVVSGIGGFAAMFRPDFSGIEDPLLVSSTDGVGTKLLLGIKHNRLEGLGIDLVAMCINDLYTLGAKPMFFLDYYATGALDEGQFKSVLTGIRSGLKQAECALLGGETAELPGLYEKKHFDLAGFVVGVVDGKKALGPNRVNAGDLLYAFPSSGFHSNGYSLLRKWLDEAKVAPSRDLIEKILTPTRIYHELPRLVEILDSRILHSVAHITGGGISGNLPRVIPDTLTSQITWSHLQRPAWMDDFFAMNGSSARDLEAIFNCGVGMIAAVAKGGADEFESACKELGTSAYRIGNVTDRRNNKEVIFV
jgi:phosphoribosylformylglycinamidine cyclo-ligase